MSKSSLQQSLKGAQMRVEPERPAPIAENTEQKASPSWERPSRQGTVHIGAYLSQDFKTNIMHIRTKKGNASEQDVIVEALNDLFHKYNLPEIAYERRVNNKKQR